MHPVTYFLLGAVVALWLERAALTAKRMMQINRLSAAVTPGSKWVYIEEENPFANPEPVIVIAVKNGYVKWQIHNGFLSASMGTFLAMNKPAAGE